MRIRNVTEEQMYAALGIVNERYGNNIEFYNGLDKIGRYLTFRLAVKSYDKPGYRLSFSGRRMKFACWHVHGEFFEAILSVCPEAIIYSLDKKIFKAGHTVYGNWQDWNIGSLWQPLNFSDACASVDHPSVCA